MTSPTPEQDLKKSASPHDTHPFARGAVIEVWHIPTQHADDWWSEPDSDEEDTENRTVRLCDIIDRRQGNDAMTWKYYVHYRDFNRRMDEWIGMDRIVSPPSVGNAKARALKKKEKEEEEAEQEKPEAPKEEGRRTRGSRRKSVDDDATVAASNVGDTGEDSEESPEKKRDVKKQVLMAPDAVTTHTVGEHVVATVKAQELDEHEGLDEASLREHEEVTKVKNVAFMELGQ